MEKYFKGVKTLEELKKLYKELAFKNHPDRGGNLEVMQLINAEYDSAFALVKNKHLNAKGEMYTKETEETPEAFRDIVNALLKLKMENVVIEIIGCFVWVNGNTKPYKEGLKALGFKFSANKTAWYLAPVGYRKKSKQKYTLEEVRAMWGSQKVNSESKDNESKAITA
jgi:curved DNA-binding protein CbpA